MNDFKKRLISLTSYKDKFKPWVRYVDDVLIISDGNEEELKVFIKELNDIDTNIQFKEEIGGKKINYLDLNIKINDEQ